MLKRFSVDISKIRMRQYSDIKTGSIKIKESIMKSDFCWYITTVVELEDPFLSLCIDSINKHSHQQIKGILIPKRLENNYAQKSYKNIPIIFVDTNQPRLLGTDRRSFRINSKSKRIDEEHAILLGYGCTQTPCCVVDSDIMILNDSIDHYILNRHKRIMSPCVFMKDEQDKWLWSGNEKVKYFRCDNDIPLIHFGSAGTNPGDSFFNNKRVMKAFNYMVKTYLSKDIIEKYFLNNVTRTKLGKHMANIIYG